MFMAKIFSACVVRRSGKTYTELPMTVDIPNDGADQNTMAINIAFWGKIIRLNFDASQRVS